MFFKVGFLQNVVKKLCTVGVFQGVAACVLLDGFRCTVFGRLLVQIWVKKLMKFD